MNYREYLAKTLQGIRYTTGRWGSRIFGAVGLFADAIAEGERQAFYQSLIGHEQQAEDSLIQTTTDRGLWRFIGESVASLGARVQNAWEAYEQAGTPQQMLRAIDEWGSARYPETWINDQCLLDESVDPARFDFEITIPFGLIDPFTINLYGDPGLVYGQPNFIYGYDLEGNFVDLWRVVKKWKPARSLGRVRVAYEPLTYVTLTVA